MKDKNGKRAVIINNIKSESIEQAIFILRSENSNKTNQVGRGIVAEAQEIINNYIKTVEGTEFAVKSHGKNKLKAILTGALLTLIIFSMILLKKI